MIPDRDLVALERVGKRVPLYSLGPMTRDAADRYLAARANRPDLQFKVLIVETCRCCGEPAWGNLRCTKHQDRNPCAVPGCRKTQKSNGRLHDDWNLCGEHWRAFVPPGSRGRRAFNRLARVAKRLGYRRTDQWPAELEDRWWRLWRGVLRRVRRGEPEDHLDQAAISRMFGWSDEGS